MLADPTLPQLRAHGVYTDRDPRVARLFAAAIEHLDLSWLDYMSVRDLRDLSGQDDLPLQALLLLSFGGLNEGSLCLPLDRRQLEHRHSDFFAAAEIAAADVADFATRDLPGLIAADTDAGMPLVHQNGFIYFQKYLVYESSLKAALTSRLRSHQSAAERLAEFADILGEVLPSGRQLNPEQQLAVALGLLQRFLIISGGPGTGKTAVVFSLLRCLMRAGITPDRVVLAAPTGRAAQRMSESIAQGVSELENPDPIDLEIGELRGRTIHRVLRYSQRRHAFTHSADQPLRADVVIIDEVSMVDVAMMARLLEATPPDCRLILLGDKDQLPSVDAGAVLADLMPRDAQSVYSPSLRANVKALLGDAPPAIPGQAKRPLGDHVVLLRHSYRSERHILDVAGLVNRGDPAVFKRVSPLAAAPPEVDWPIMDGGAYWIEADHERSDQWRLVLDSWLRRHFLDHYADRGGSYLDLAASVEAVDLVAELDTERVHNLLSDLFASLDTARILTVTRRGLHGCDRINTYFHQRLVSSERLATRGRLFAGAPIMISRNDYGLGLFNGDIGIALQDKSGNWRVAFRRQAQFELAPVDLLPEWELAFASTVHKSQGAEYAHILLVLPPNPEHRLLNKEIIYTGLTRAKRLAVIYAAKPTLSRAIAQRVVRDSGLDLWPQPTPVAPPKPEPVREDLAGLPLFEFLDG
ncbi:MAG: exodeoxyribonuclease V alpha subunit [Rhodothermales bacterium]|jgi:exodeoxyribonuclease V alpha subunit